MVFLGFRCFKADLTWPIDGRVGKCPLRDELYLDDLAGLILPPTIA